MTNPQPPLDPKFMLPFEQSDTSRDERDDSLFESLAEDIFPGADGGDEEDDSTPSGRTGQAPDEEGESGDSEEDEDAEGADEDSEDDEAEEDDEDADDEEPVALDPQTKVKIKVDGEEVEVTLKEAFAGYSRTAKFTREMQALRQKEQEEVGAYREAREAYAKSLEKVKVLLESAVPQEPDWDQLRKELPAGEFSARFIEHQNARRKLDMVDQTLQKVQEEREAEFQRELGERRQSEFKALLEKIPEWADEGQREKDHEALRRHARDTYGYSDQELDGIADHRLLLVLRDAAEGARLKAKGSKTLKGKVKQAKRLPPGGRERAPKVKGNRKAALEARKRLARTGRIDDAARALELSGLVD